jgi:hypothetical protein
MPNKSTEAKLKAHLQQKTSPVPEHLWMQISQALAQPATKNKPKRKAYLWYSCAASLLLLAGLLGFLMPKKQNDAAVFAAHTSSNTATQHKQNTNGSEATSLATAAIPKIINHGLEAKIWPEKPATSQAKTQPNAPVVLAKPTTPVSLASSHVPQISTEKNRIIANLW